MVKKHVVAEGLEGEEASETAGFLIELVQQAPWQNDVDPNDVNNDGDVVAEDVLLVINFINAAGSGAITNASARGPFFDADGDNNVSASDVLKVINWINASGDAEEGEAGGRATVIAGGLGLDPLAGGGGSDLLIAGTGANDNRAAALAAIVAEWNSARPLADRMANLRSGTRPVLSGLDLALKAKEGVSDDAGVDKLLGETDLDWFWSDLK